MVVGQIAINHAVHELGIVWDEDSDMRYENSTDLGTGTISSLPANADGRPFTVTLLPHRYGSERYLFIPILPAV